MRLGIHKSIDVRKPVVILIFFGGSLFAAAESTWNNSAQRLAQKIVAITGPGAVTLKVENRSSLSQKNFEAASGSLRRSLESLGARAAEPDQAASSASVWLSENPKFYLWVAEVQQGIAQPTVVMVSIPRGETAEFSPESPPMRIRQVPLWTQAERILDVSVLEEDSAPKHIAVLDGDKLTIYRTINREWQIEQSLPISHARPWPRDLRGRVITTAQKDHLLDVYLPGVFCHAAASIPLTLTCRESDDPWPLTANETSFPTPGQTDLIRPVSAFYSSSRNFFTGALAPGIGKVTMATKFYSAAPLSRPNYTLWLFAATDGEVHFIDGLTDQTEKLDWGSDITSVKTTCGTGWQVMATRPSVETADSDSISLYELGDRDPMPVSAAASLPGELTALWTERRGDTAIAVVRNRKSETYEALRLAVDCRQ